MLNVPDTVPSGSSTGNPRNKVALKRGRGIMDWVRLGHTTPDLAGTEGKLLMVTPEELAKHNKREDAWIALKGNVYNVTPYFEYHPGGEDELLKGAGIDATDLFNEVHKWVNFTSMLKKCQVGTLTDSPKSFFSKPNFLPLKKIGKVLEVKKDSCLIPPSLGLLPCSKSPGDKSPASPQYSIRPPPPKYDWFQTKTLINVVIYTKWKEITTSHVLVINHEEYFKAVVRIRDEVFTMHLELFKPVERSFQISIGHGGGKVDILMKKALPGVRWTSLGKAKLKNNEIVPIQSKEIEYISLKICEKVKLTHNAYFYVLEVPEFIHFGIPVGHHVYLRYPETDIVKPYTPVITPFLINNNEEEYSQRKIQIYFKVYPEGQLTPLLERLQEGDSVDVSHPEGSFSVAHLKRATQEAGTLVLLGAGTGITPHIRLMLEALRNDVKTCLITFNKTEEDIPWRIELDSLVVTHTKLLRVTHVLSNPSECWTGPKGRVRRDLLEELLPPSEGDAGQFFGVCGTTGFTDLAVSLLEELGHQEENIFAFKG